MATVSSAATPTVKDGAYAWYVVGVLTLAQVISLMLVAVGVFWMIRLGRKGGAARG